jgi:hypothetical protein
MNAFTRGRIIAAAGFLAASTLFGTALAAGPAMTQEGKPAMTHEGNSAMTQEGTLAAVRKVRPAPWDVAKPAPQHEVVLTGMVDE